jgi:hypothetical protein
MVGHIGRWETFVGLGIGTELLALAGLRNSNPPW